jgi:2-polyprenyl-6-methoxyphenol hydroxylase-like FAD-dependent oxidoreductase
MRKILIVGAGQAGLQLAHGLLLAGGYEVTVMSQRPASEIRHGRVTSTQCMFGAALDLERCALGVDLWSAAESGHRIDGLGVSVPGPDGAPAINWLGRLSQYAQSVDQRLKMAAWLELFAERGGTVVINAATVSDLDHLSTLYDLVIVAAGKGDIVGLFDRDAELSPYSVPQRSLAVAYVHGVEPRAEHPDTSAVRLDLIPTVGELIVIPALTTSGTCDILFWEGIPGGPLDTFDQLADDPGAHLARTLELIRQFAPWEYERCAAAELTDAGATLVGRYAPVVRHPIATLPSGRLALGIADVVVANDPITGQGSNNASRAADAYLTAILAHGDRPYDQAFMQAAFDSYWASVAVCTAWTNAMLAPPPPHVLDILGAAAQHQEIADRFANDFSTPDDFADWLLDPIKAGTYLADVAAR